MGGQFHAYLVLWFLAETSTVHSRSGSELVSIQLGSQNRELGDRGLVSHGCLTALVHLLCA